MQEIQRRSGCIFGADQIGVVDVRLGIDLHGYIGAILVFKAGVDLIEACRLEIEQDASLLPTHEILQRLEHCEIDFQLLCSELGVNLPIKHVTEAASNSNVDARVALFEFLCSGLKGRHRPPVYSSSVFSFRAFA